MKKYLVLIALMATGCATTSSNQSMRDQVSQLEQRAHQQDEQIAKLQQQLEQARQTESTFYQTWTWVKEKSANMWNSEYSQDVRERLQKCWDDLQKTNH